MTLWVGRALFQTAPRWNVRWVSLIQENQSAPLNDCQTSALCISPQPQVWFPLQISCYGHVLISLGVFDLEAPRRCQDLDYSEDAVQQRHARNVRLYHKTDVLKEQIAGVPSWFCCVCLWMFTISPNPIVDFYCLYYSASVKTHSRTLFSVRTHKETGFRRAGFEARGRQREIVSVCLELDMRNCGASALSRSWP